MTFYVLQYYGSGVHDVIEHLARLESIPDAQRAMEYCVDDFADPNGDAQVPLPRSCSKVR